MEWEYRAEIVRIDEEEVLLVILDKQKFAREPNLEVTLFRAFPRRARWRVLSRSA